MESLKIDTGTIRLLVNDDPARVIQFNPNDVSFVERFYGLVKDLEDALEKYKARAKSLDDAGEVDGYGIPLNAGERVAFLRETCEFFRAKIDILFGEGTSQSAFGDALVLESFDQFFAGIMPFIQNARSEKMARYVNKKVSGRVMK